MSMSGKRTVIARVLLVTDSPCVSILNLLLTGKNSSGKPVHQPNRNPYPTHHIEISSVVLSSGSIKNDWCQQGSTDHLQHFNTKVLVTKNQQTSRIGDFPSRQAYTKCSVKLWNILGGTECPSKWSHVQSVAVLDHTARTRSSVPMNQTGPKFRGVP